MEQHHDSCEGEQILGASETAFGIAAHEIRNPLNALRLQLELLAQSVEEHHEISTEFSAVLMRRVEAAIASTRKIDRLVNDLRDVALAAQGKLKIESGSADLVAIIQEVIGRARKVERECPPIGFIGPEMILGTWDRLRVDQVVANLLDNAIRFSASRPIEIIAGVDESNARIEIRDHGVGIPADRLEQIFDAFATTSEPNRRHFGLGLWIVRMILGSMRGKISVSSKVGEGTSFIVQLPRE